MPEYALDGRIGHLVEEAIREDLGLGDLTTDAIIDPGVPGHGRMVLKETGVVAGLEAAEMVFNILDPGTLFRSKIQEGEVLPSGTIIAHIDGMLSTILRGERTALNVVQRMSGIATLTRAFVDAVSGTSAKITDTRKTAPGLRVLDKLAVKIGGGVNHRFGLDDMVLVKDNHIDAAGGVGAALKRVAASVGHRKRTFPVEVETRSMSEVEEALRYPVVDRIMLDNFTVEEMKMAVDRIAGAVEVEASGNVTLANVREIAETGVDFISVGALTHSARALDISLKAGPEPSGNGSGRKGGRGPARM